MPRLTAFVFPLFILPLTGSLQQPSRPKPSRVDFEARSNQIRAVAARGDYLEARALYRKAAEDARRVHESASERLFLTNAGACEIALFQYRDALKSLSAARELAAGPGDQAALARLGTNLSSLYSQMGNLPEAARASEEALHYRKALQLKSQTALLLQAGNARAELGNLPAAEPLFLEGIDLATQSGEKGTAQLDTAAVGWDYLGYRRLKAGNQDAAEIAATEGFRLRKTHHLNGIESSYMNLGAIRALQGDTRSALVLLDAAEKALHQPTNRTRAWYIYTERGRVKLQAGHLAAALADLREALALARVWRADVVPDDANRSSSEATLAELYSLLIEAGNRLYLETGDSALIQETFEAAEENRAASLRALVPKADDWRNRLPDRYWQSLTKLQAAQARWLQLGEKAAPAVAAIQSELAEIEAAAGAPPPSDRTAALDKVRATLDSNSVLFSFQLGDRQSWVWEVTGHSLVLRMAPGRKELADLVESFNKSLGQTSGGDSGTRLYRGLFGKSNPDIEGRKRWLLALEGDLFEIPFPALPLSSGQPLITAHSIQIISGARMLGGKRGGTDIPGPFLGVGDPVYNRADPRGLKPEVPALLSRIGFGLGFSQVDAASQPAFARLWGTGKEIADSAKAWNAGESILLTGREASGAGFWSAMERKPSIIHLATHIVEKNDRLETGWIALSQARDGRLDYLTPAQISARSVAAQLVVLSGCSSGKAEVRTASGLMGLTRAWIAAGAGSVLATRWPTIDDNGAFFQSFYRHFRRDPEAGSAEALRQASLEMLNSGTWRNTSAFWAGYFVVGNY